MSDGARPHDALPPGTSSLGLTVLLGTLAVLFAGTLMSSWWLRDLPRFQVAGEGPPPLPAGLWLVTLLLGALSFTVERAVRVAARYRPGGARRPWLLGLGLALLFLVVQSWNWTALWPQETGEGPGSFYAFHFYLLTVLHALHVVGGIAYHLVALRRGEAASMRNAARYWHFLGAVWVVLLLNLWLLRVPHPHDTWLSPASLWVFGFFGGLGVLFWVQSLRVLWERDKRGFAVVGLLFFPFALLQAWGQAEEFGTRRLAFRWALALGAGMVALIFAIAIHAEPLSESGVLPLERTPGFGSQIGAPRE